MRCVRPPTLLLASLVLACGGSPPRGDTDVQVISFAPQGPIERAEPITIRFDRPVVGEEEVARPVDPGAIAVMPAFAWTGHWQDQRTLVVEPDGPLAPSTRYEVALAGALAARSGGFRLAFVHRPLAVDGLAGNAVADQLAPGEPVQLAFNQPVRPREAAAHCRLTPAAAAPIALAPAPGTPDEPAAVVALAPAATLEPGARYQLDCAGLTGAGGNAPLAQPFTLAVRARPLLAVTAITPDGDDIPADEVTLTVAFSTPVALDAARRAITSTPAIRGLQQGQLSQDGLQYQVTADLDTETLYQVRIAGLVDTAGQRLAAPRTHAFTTGDARPRLSMERGIFALEASAKGYPLWSRNVGAFEIECAAIPKDRVVQLLTSDMNYDPWGGNDDDQPIDWRKLRVTAKKTAQREARKNKWRLHELPLGTLCSPAAGAAANARGVYLAEISSRDVTPDAQRGWLSPRRNRVLANVTDLGVLLKVGTASGIVWVTSLSAGAPVGGARVTVYTPAGKQVWTGATDADGLARIPGSAELKLQPAAVSDGETDWDSYRAQRLIAVVEAGADTAIVDGNWANGIQSWNFGVTEDRRGGATKLRGFIQSDRGLYRPGERVHFKGLAREIAQGRPPRVPATRHVAIEVQDSRGQTVLTTTASLSPFGGFAFDHALGAEAALGDYQVRAKIGDQVFRERFSVEEFRAATFELGLTPRTAQPTPGEPLAFELDARYLFGAPVAGAAVTWRLRRRAHEVAFPGYDSYTFSANPRAYWWDRGDRDDYGEQLADGTGTTDAQGRFAIRSRDGAKLDGSVDYIVAANVTDPADQTIGKTAIVTAHKTSLYLGLFANEFVQAVGMPFGVNLVALRPDGTRTAAAAKLTVTRTVRTCEWSSSGARGFESCTAAEKPMLARDVAIGATGTHTERIYPTEPGDYVIRIEARDDRGNTVAAASQLWVIGKGEAFWSGDEGARMTVIASKARYVPGETARLVAQANLVTPTALVTIERDGVIDARVRRLASAAEGIEIPITGAYAPNVFASIALVSGRHGDGDRHRPQFKMGLVELAVSTAAKQLDVAVALEQDQVRPGEPVRGTITVTSGGAPVPAEVSLSAADEGVLQLIRYVTPNPMATFYAPYGLGVDAGTSWNRIARLADPESGDPDVGGDSGSTAGGQRVRSRFVASAHWAPMLVTDARGEIAFAFTAPDNLTAFRLMAIAADAADRFGAGERRLTVAKPLMAVPALPRFLRGGDAASVGVIVHNHTDAAGTATVSAVASGAALEATAQTVAVPAGGSARVRFRAVAAPGAAAAAFQFAIAMGRERDAVRATVPVDQPRERETRILVEKRLAPGEAWRGPIGAGAGALPGESTVAITIDRSGLGELAPGLRSLVEYPYGCLEQTLSRLLPLVAAKDLARTLDDPTLQGARAAEYVRAGLAKVLRHQQGDGLFSLWPQSNTYPHLSVYALWGLTIAERAGEKVPAEVFANGVRALGRWANETAQLGANSDSAIAAMAAYVMALRGQADRGLHARLYAQRAALPTWGAAFLLRAMKLAKAERAELDELQRELVAKVVVAGGRATVTERAGYDHRAHMSSDVRAAAMVLAALLEVDPASVLIDPLAAGLKSARDRGGAWGSTQENLWSLIALAEYGRRTATGETTVTVRAGGRQLAQQRIRGGEVATVKLALAAIGGDELEVVTDQGAAIAARVTEVRADGGAAAAQGFELERRYLDAAGREATAFKAGDLVTVKLVVMAPAARRWVALVDPVPAGFEVINPKLAAGGAPEPDATDARRRSLWHGVTWDHQELRDDRVVWFADQMRAGTFELTYRARATIDGAFTAAPSTIEAMYEPTVRARTARAAITVTK